MLLAHSLEKGLGMVERKPDFGLQKARDLLRYMILYREYRLDTTAFEYREASAILNCYVRTRENCHCDVSEFKKILMEREEKLPAAGAYTVQKSDLQYSADHFKRLCEVRHSVREFSRIPVTKEEIERAMSIAIKAPSACNRQMIRVYCSMDPQDQAQLGKIVPGNRGFETEVDKYLFLTADRTAFDECEIGQWYVNGGIFAAYLQLAFAAHEIGSCLFQWPKNPAAERKVKSLLKIPPNEVIISVFGVGHYKDTFKVLFSARKGLEEICMFR